VTPRQFASHIAAVDEPAGRAFAAVVERYYGIRFGGQPERQTDRALFDSFAAAFATIQPATFKVMGANLLNSGAQISNGRPSIGQSRI